MPTTIRMISDSIVICNPTDAKIDSSIFVMGAVELEPLPPTRATAGTRDPNDRASSTPAKSTHASTR